MNKRHKWKKIRNERIIYKGKNVYVRETKICEICGLKKGFFKLSVINRYRYSRFEKFIYFKNGEILSENYLPYTCIDYEFIKEEEMMIK